MLESVHSVISVGERRFRFKNGEWSARKKTDGNQQQPATTINVGPVRFAGLDSRHEYHLVTR